MPVLPNTLGFGAPALKASFELAALGAGDPDWKMLGCEEGSPFEPLEIEEGCGFASSFFARSGFVHFLLNPPKPPPLPLPPNENPLALPFPFSLTAGAAPPKALAAPLSPKAGVSCLAPKTLDPPNGFGVDDWVDPPPNADGADVAAAKAFPNAGALGVGFVVGACPRRLSRGLDVF